MTPRSSTSHAPQLVTIYDGQCVLCRQSKRVIEAFDWRDKVMFLDLHDGGTVQERYPELDYEQLMGALHVVTLDGSVLAGFPALRHIARFLPVGWLLVPWLYLPGMNSIGPRIYNWVARHRYQINRLFGASTCDEEGTCRVH